MDDEFCYPDGFMPGDQVDVIDGTFVGMKGSIVCPDRARALRKKNGGQDCIYAVLPGCVWVALMLFDRLTPVMLQPDQIRVAQS
jgi:transcription antitermination factor NusG